MNQELVNELLQKALQYFNSAEAFATKEIPLYVQELLQFKFVEHLLDSIGFSLALGLFFTLFFSCMIVLLRYGNSQGNIDNEYSEDAFKFGRKVFISTFIISILLVFTFNDNTIQAYKAKYAPRVYLMDYLKGK